MAKYFLKKLSDLSVAERQEIVTAIERGDAEFVKDKISQGYINLDGLVTKDGESVVALAVKRNYREILKLLLDSHTPNITEGYGLKEEALLLAVEFGSLSLVQWLVTEEHANVRCKDLRNYGITPLLRAAHSGHLDIVKWLLDEGGSLMSETDNDGVTVVHYAASKGHVELVKWLLQRIGTQNQIVKTKYDWTPLHCAAQGGSLIVTQLLVEEYHYDINAKTSNGSTPLLLAAFKGHLNVVEYLFKKGASLKERTRKGFNAFLLATWGGHFSVLKWVYNEDSSLIRSKDAYGNTAVIMAVQFGHLEILKWLITQAPDLLNEQNVGGDTAALIACKEFRLEALLHLIASGANVDIKNKDNKHCLDYLSRNISRAPEIDEKLVNALSQKIEAVMSTPKIFQRIVELLKRTNTFAPLIACCQKSWFLLEKLCPPLSQVSQQGFAELYCNTNGLTVTTLEQPWEGREVDVVVKKFSPKDGHEDIKLRRYLCILSLTSVRNPHLLRCEGWYRDDKNIFVLLEKANMNILEFIEKMSKNHIPFINDQNRSFYELKIIVDMVSGVHALHKLNLSHGNLKPENILIFITPEGQLSAKVSDVGFTAEPVDARKDDLMQIGKLIYLIHSKVPFSSKDTDFKETLVSQFPNKEKDVWYNLIELCLTAPKTDVTSKKVLQFLELYQDQLL